MDPKLHPLLRKQFQEFEESAKNEKNTFNFLRKISDTYRSLEYAKQQLGQSLEISRKQNKHTNLKIESIARNANNAVDHITEVIFETDLEGHWIYLNQAWEKLTGLKVIDCLGNSFLNYLESLRPMDNLELKTLLKTNFKSYCKVIKINKGPNRIIWLDINVKKISSISGKPTGYIGTICDITEQKQEHLSLLRSKEKEVLANKAKDDFLSTISHEIRTPLNAVIGTSHLLLSENPRKEQIENLNILKHSSEHLLSLVNNILDFNKIDNGSVEIEEIEFNFQNILNQFHATYSKLALEKGIKFSVSSNGEIPERLMGDPTRLAQILTNLLSNGLKFTPSGEVALNIKKLSQTKNHVSLNFEIIDTGIGISKGEQVKIFHSFTQANNSTARKFGGTGLGLSICKKLLRAMDSKIHVKSEPNIGSVFTFSLTFPLPENSSGTPIFETRKHIDHTNLNGLSVLVAEDNKINVLLIKKFLKKWDVDFEIAYDGIEAVKKFKSKSFDLVLMDIMMPNMNGFEATKAIRKINEDITVIALSAASGVHIKKEFDEAGINGHIGKPFHPNKLLEALNEEYRKLNCFIEKHH